MLAHMVRMLIEEKQDKEVKNRAVLYEKFISYILTKYKHGKSKLDPDFRTQIRKSLAKIAYDALAKKEPHIQKVPLEFCYDKNRLPNNSRGRKGEFLTKSGLVNLIVEQSGTGDKDFLFFTHQSFQEYLAAEWMSLNPQKLFYVLNRGFNYKWEESIKFLTGIKGVPILDKILSSNCYTSQNRRVFFALECLEEISEIKNKEEADFVGGLAIEGFLNPYFNDTSCGGSAGCNRACIVLNGILNKCLQFTTPDKPAENGK